MNSAGQMAVFTWIAQSKMLLLFAYFLQNYKDLFKNKSLC